MTNATTDATDALEAFEQAVLCQMTVDSAFSDITRRACAARIAWLVTEYELDEWEIGEEANARMTEGTTP